MDEKTTKAIEEIVTGSLKGLDIDEKIAKALETQDAKIEKVNKNFIGNTEKISELEGKAKMAAFVKAVAQGNRQEISAVQGKALSGGTDSAGGYLVPDEFRAEVIRMIEDYGIVRRLARIVPMKRDTLNLPKVTASVTVYWPGENTAGTASQPTLAQVQLLAKTAIGLTVTSNELLEDSEVDTIDLLVELFAEALAGEEDSQGLVGTGTPFDGVLTDTDANVVTLGSGDTTFASFDADDLRDMVAAIKPLALTGAAFVMHRSVWASVQKLKENSQHIASFSNPLVTGDASVATGIVGYVWGYPVYLSEQMPSTTAVDTEFMIFGNLKYLYFGDRKQMTLSVSDSATVGAQNTFESNASAVRVTERIALTVGLGEAFAVLKTAAA